MKKEIKKIKQDENIEVPKGEFDIRNIKNLIGVRSVTSVPLKVFRKIAELLMAGKSVKDIIKTGEFKKGSVSNYCAEVRRASKSGFSTIEQYYSAGRPCRSGKRIVGKA